MAPFNTHFLVAEKIWPELQDGLWYEQYGQFCFGCVAPDVDKASATLSQKDTHFFDRTGDYELMVTTRTVTFLQQQAKILIRPFTDLTPEAQAFVLGYLCHLCVDEVSKHLWRNNTWGKFWPLHPTSAFAALDEVAWQHTQDYEAIRRAIQGIEAQDAITFIPLPDLQKMLDGVQAFTTARNVEGEYAALLDLFSPNHLFADREKNLARFREEIDTARQWVHTFDLETVVQIGLARTRQRVADLLAGRVPEPGYPVSVSN